jgi:hypothetical protein
MQIRKLRNDLHREIYQSELVRPQGRKCFIENKGEDESCISISGIP